MRKKIVLVYKDIEDNIAEETVWAISLNNNNYKIDNIPFFAPNLAYEDIISIENDNGVLYFDDLIQPSGHSTIQVIFFDKEKSNDVIQNLEKFGCKWESMKEQPYYAIDIAPNIDYKTVKDYLNSEYDKGVLDYKESCLA